LETFVVDLVLFVLPGDLKMSDKDCLMGCPRRCKTTYYSILLIDETAAKASEKKKLLLFCNICKLFANASWIILGFVSLLRLGHLLLQVPNLPLHYLLSFRLCSPLAIDSHERSHRDGRHVNHWSCRERRRCCCTRTGFLGFEGKLRLWW